MVVKKLFLEEHRSAIIQKTRNPIHLADKLLEKKFISAEMFNKIQTQLTNEDKIREIFNCLKAKKHFTCAFDWLKKNECELFEELAQRNTEAAEPPEKRVRFENMDEADHNVPGFPDLKKISTFARLEHWVSQPENSQKLISGFKEKLGDEGMEALEKELKDKEPKKSLWFNACNIDEIRKNKEIGSFLSATKSKKIPRLTYSMFFRKAGSTSSGGTAQSSNDNDDIMDVTAVSDSSGYASLSSSLNESRSLLDNLLQNEKTFADEVFLLAPSHNGDMDNLSHGNKDDKNESKTTPAPQEDTHRNMNMQETPIHEMKEQPQSVPNVPDTSVSVYQIDHVSKGEIAWPEDGYGSMNTRDVHIHEELPTANVSKHEDESTEDTCGSTNMQEALIYKIPQRLNVSNVPHIEGKSESLDMQDKHVDQMNDNPQGSNVPTHENMLIEDTRGSMNMQETQMNEMKEQPHRFNVPHTGVSVQKTDQVTKNQMLQEHRSGSMDIQDEHIDEMDGEPEKSNVPHTGVSLHQTDQVTKNQMLLEDRSGSMDIQDEHIDEMDGEPQTSNVSSHEDESIIKKATPLEDGLVSLDMKDTYTYKMDAEPQTSPHRNGSIKTQTPVEDRNQNISMQQHKASKAPKKRVSLKSQRENKKREKDKLLHDWALKQCDGNEEELKAIFDQILIKDLAEHSSYPCYTAESVMVYKYLTSDSQIIFISDDNTNIKTMTMVHYHMFVCNIKKAVLLGPKKPIEQVIVYNESNLPLDKCKNFIFKAFAPALAVYKKIQREERLYSLI